MTVTATITPAENGVIHLILCGRLSLTSVVEVRRLLQKCAAEHPIAVIIDVAALSVDDAVLLTVFPAAVAAFPPPRVTLVLVSAPPALRAMTGGWLLRSVAMCDTPEQAVALLVDQAAGQVLRHELPADATSPSRARAIAAGYCRQHSLSERADSVVLIVSELVSNAVRHARGAPQIRLALRGDFLYVSVRDSSSRPPALAEVDHLNVSPLPRSGRGLHLVDVHASAWGSIPSENGKTVWAAIRVVPAGQR